MRCGASFVAIDVLLEHPELEGESPLRSRPANPRQSARYRSLKAFYTSESQRSLLDSRPVVGDFYAKQKTAMGVRYFLPRVRATAPFRNFLTLWKDLTAFSSL